MRFQNTWPYALGDKINLIAQHHQTDIQNSNTSYSCVWTLGNGQTLTQCNPGYFSYTGHGNYHIVLTIKDKYGQQCQSDEYVTIETDHYMQGSGVTTDDSDLWIQVVWPGSWWFVGWDSVIDLKCVMTNPIGSDTHKEFVRLYRDRWSAVDLSDYRLVVGGKNKTLSGILLSGQTLDLYRSWWFSNSKTGCISLTKDGSVIDTLCYPVLDEGEEYCEWTDRVSTSTWLIKKITKKTITSIQKDQIDRLKASCQKKIDRLQLSKDKMKARYEKRILSCKQKTETIRKNYATYRTNTKKRVDLLKWEMYLYRNYTTLVNTELKNQRPAVIEHSDIIRHSMDLLNQGKTMIKNKKTMVHIWPCLTLPYYKLKDIIKAQHNLGTYYARQWVYLFTPVAYQWLLADMIVWYTWFGDTKCLYNHLLWSWSIQTISPTSAVEDIHIPSTLSTTWSSIVLQYLDQESIQQNESDLVDLNALDDWKERYIPQSGLIVHTELIQTQEMMP
jgi:hypothetical protein